MATLRPDYIEVEYDLTYSGGDYTDVGETARIPVSVIEEYERRGHPRPTEAAFREVTGHEPCHIVHYSNEVVEDDEEDDDDEDARPSGAKAMPYQRVLPRDLFNEAKLLKCLGQLALILHDHEGQYPVAFEHEDPTDGFLIDQDPSCGVLFCTNLRLVLRGQRDVSLFIPYNNKDAYPLYFADGDAEARVFYDNGTLSRDFLDWMGGGDSIIR